jgi:endonuclease/exonuclease/phosphatase family metal-dependent hydrolase
MRIATFNVENLFKRSKAMNRPEWSEGQPAIDAVGALNALVNKAKYTASDKKKMLAILEEQELLATRPNNKFIEFRKIRGALFRTKEGVPSIVANGRADWVGWFELKAESIDDDAILNTARVISEVNPDILTLVEVEDRVALQRFVDQVLTPFQKEHNQPAYEFNMVIDGNDDRGIDVGVLSRKPIVRMRSHITDTTDAGKRTFSRDCPEYYIALDDSTELVVMPNHFASKGSDLSGARRKVQAKGVKAIYETVIKTHKLVLVSGDLNDHPDGGSLDELLDTELTEAMSLPLYQGGFPGTYKTARKADKIDYLLLSPELRDRVTHVDVFRKGFYAPTKWESFENITKTTKDRFQASDHHCVYADVNLP